MTGSEANMSLSRDDLLALVVSLQEQVARLQRQVEQQAVVNEALRKQNAELTRSGKRQAAPFSKGTRTPNPKPSGRKPGEGTFSYREAPLPEEVTEPKVDVPVTTVICPGSGGRLQHGRVDVVSVTDIPPMPRPQVTEYRVQVCRIMNLAEAGYSYLAHH